MFIVEGDRREGIEGQNKLIVAGGWNRKVIVWRDDTGTSAAAGASSEMLMPMWHRFRVSTDSLRPSQSSLIGACRVTTRT